MIAINPEYYEAASLDGANAWQKIWHDNRTRTLISLNVPRSQEHANARLVRSRIRITSQTARCELNRYE